MKHYDEYIIQLIQLYLVGDLSGEEKVKLEEWVSQDPSHEKLFKEMGFNWQQQKCLLDRKPTGLTVEGDD